MGLCIHHQERVAVSISSKAAILPSVLPVTFIPSSQPSEARERRSRKSIPIEEYRDGRGLSSGSGEDTSGGDLIGGTDWHVWRCTMATACSNNCHKEMKHLDDRLHLLSSLKSHLRQTANWPTTRK